MKCVRLRLEINLPELDQILDQARQTPLSEEDHQKLKHALHTLAEYLMPVRNSERTKTVLADATEQAATEPSVSRTRQNPSPGLFAYNVAEIRDARLHGERASI